MEFPTEKEFKRWWIGKVDGPNLLSFPRSVSCPMARFLQDHGYPWAVVDLRSWAPGAKDMRLRPMPVWAQKLREQLDRKYYGDSANER